MPFAIKVLVFNSTGEEVVLLYQGGISQMAGAPSLSGTLVQAGSLGVNMIFTGTLASGGQVLSWAGESNNGNPVTGGIYYVSIVSTDIFGTVSTYNLTLSVIEPKSSSEINIYNSAGELVYHEGLSAPGGSITGLDLDNQVLVLDGMSSPGLKLSGTLHGNGGNKPWSWDGKNMQGQQVAPGIYQVKVSAGQGSGGGLQMTKSVQLLASEGAELSALKPFVAPNPVTGAWLAAGNPLLVRFTAGSGTLNGRLYNLNGELISNSTAAGNSGQMKFYPGPLSSGVYLMALDYINSFGARSRVNLKLVILS